MVKKRQVFTPLKAARMSGPTSKEKTGKALRPLSLP
jgi:hypothetical protein